MSIGPWQQSPSDPNGGTPQPNPYGPLPGRSVPQKRPESYGFAERFKQEDAVKRENRTPVKKWVIVGAVLTTGAVVLYNMGKPGDGQTVSLGSTDRGVSFSLLLDTDNNRVWAQSNDPRFGSAILIDAVNGNPLNSERLAAFSEMDSRTLMVFDYPSCSPDMVTLTFNQETREWDTETQPAYGAPFIVNGLGRPDVLETCRTQFAQGRSLTD